MQGDASNAQLFERLPFLAHMLLSAHLADDACAVVAASAVCKPWRRAVQGALDALSPKSERALSGFVPHCSGLHSLQLGRAMPCACADAGHHSRHFSAVTALSSLTSLGLGLSQTAVWRGAALTLSRANLACVSVLTHLQALDLSHQQCLCEPGVLGPLLALPRLQQLVLCLGRPQRPHISSWHVLAQLTTLRVLDVSGWGVCCPSQHTQEGAAVACGDAARHGPGAAQRDPLSTAVARDTLAPPVHMLAPLRRLQELHVREWPAPLAMRCFVLLRQLQSVTALDVSRCCLLSPSHPGDELHAPAGLRPPLWALVTSLCRSEQPAAAADGDAGGGGGAGGSAGTDTPASLQPQQQQQQAASPQPVLPLRVSNLQRLCLAHLKHVRLTSELWGALPALAALDVSAVEQFQGQGLSQLQQLQELRAAGCSQLDYDSVCQVLLHCRQLRRLQLQGSTIILHGEGATAAAMRRGRYHTARLQLPPEQPAAAGASQAAGAAAARGSSGDSSSSRRDVAATPSTGAAAGTPGAAPSAAGTAPGGHLSLGPLSLAQLPAAAAAAAGDAGAAHAPQPNGLQELCMDECELVFEALVWRQPQSPQHGPKHPALLLFDMCAAAGAQRLQALRALSWRLAAAPLSEALLLQLVPLAARSLRRVNLSRAALPAASAPRCWQALALATNLQDLNLGNESYSKTAYKTAQGMNPTAALLASMAGAQRLQRLALSGWSFAFASLKPLAGLAGSLSALDLSHARDVTDTTLWSLTHLTSLTRLDIAGARVASDQIFSLIFVTLAQLRHLDLGHISSFTARSLKAVTQLAALSYLDIRATGATASAAAVDVLGALRRLRWLGVSLGPAQAAEAGSSRLSEVYSRGAGAGVLSTGCGYGSSSGRDAAGSAASSPDFDFLAAFGDARFQSLRVLCLGRSTPSIVERCRQLLPPWLEVH